MARDTDSGPAPSDFLTPQQISEMLQVKRSKAYEIAHECGFVAVGKLLRVRRADLDRWVAERYQEPCRRDTERLSTAELTALIEGPAYTPTGSAARPARSAPAKRRPAARPADASVDLLTLARDPSRSIKRSLRGS